MANADAWNAGWGIGGGLSRAKMSGGGGKKASKPPVDKITTSEGGTLTPSEQLKGEISYRPPVQSRKTGGPIRKTGLVKLHKGEYVLTAAQAKEFGHKIGRKKSGSRKSRSRKG